MRNLNAKNDSKMRLNNITLSSAEEEYQGELNACNQAIWLKGILAEFNIGSTTSIFIVCDSHRSIKIQKNMVMRQRTKDIEICMHYIREIVHDKTIVL